MAKAKVILAGSPTKVVTIDTAATDGATIGLNLRLPNGQVATLAQLIALFAGTTTVVSGGGSGTNVAAILTTPGDLLTRAGSLVRLGIGAAGTTLRSNGTAPAWQAPAALSKVDDTNVTLTLGGNPATALLASASLTLGWTGTLGVTRGGTGFGSYTIGDLIYANGSASLAKLAIGTAGDILKTTAGAPSWTNPAALTKTDDTNVTLTLGGSAATALVNAASLTLGWSGTLAAIRGGTGFGSYTVGDILYANSTTTLAKLAVGTDGFVLTLASGVPTWAAPAGGGGGYPEALGYAGIF